MTMSAARRGLLLVLAGLLAAPGPAAVVYLPASQFEFTGDWQRQAGERNALGEILLYPQSAGARPAVGAVMVPQAGSYTVMVRARDFPHDRPGIRRFAVEVGGRRLAPEFGAHGNPDPGAQGWAWEAGGTLELPAGPVVLALVGLTAFARCDAVALVSDGDGPPRTREAALAAPPAAYDLEVRGLALPPVPTAPVAVTGAPLAVLANDHCRLEFARCDGPEGPTVALRVSAGDRVLVDWTAETYHLLQAPSDVQVRQPAGARGQWPAWSPSRELTCQAGLGTVTYPTTLGDDRWLPLAGQPHLLHPTPEVVATSNKVQLTAAGAAGRVTATWRLPTGARQARLRLRFESAVEGSWGLGYSLGYGRQPAELTEVLCPYLHQFQRWPEAPRLITTESLTTPLGVYSTTAGTAGLVLDPAGLDPGWPDARQLEAGLQMAEPDGSLRPTAWGPVPGGQGSRLGPGDAAELHLAVVATPGDGFTAWQQVATDLCGWRDYRHNHEVSLTQAALNAIALMKDDRAGGWSAEGLGFWNIESPETVTNAAPLAVLSAALLTSDEVLLATRAVPLLASLMSRPDVHFQVTPDGTGRIGSPRLGAPTALYGETVRAAAEAMCRGWLAGYPGLPTADSDPVRTGGYGKQRAFEDSAAAWRVRGRPADRAALLADLEAYLADLPRWAATSPSPSAFYQLSYTGNFEGLLAVADLVDDPRVLATATRLARAMITGLFTTPTVREEPLGCHPDGRFEGNGIRWWAGPGLFTLGFPPLPPGAGDDWETRQLPPAILAPETVPGWVPSIVGLGIEQPTTYRRGRGPCAPILMANWAPALLRLGALADEPALTVAAHNAVLGRFANYPGYYATGFTPVPGRADYPYQGPDLSGIYYHHIPPFVATLLDYLVTDIEVRSSGAIAFPSERQMGYAWFDNRVFGHAPGTVYGEAGAWPWLREGLVTIDSPRLNWLAAHTADRVWVMLTNTGFEPVTARVVLDPAATGGAAGPVSVRLDNGPARPLALADGAVAVSLPAQGLAVLEWQGCWVDVPLHQAAARSGPRPAPIPPVEAPGGQLHSGLVGTDPEHLWWHLYSAHDGTQYRQATLEVSGDGPPVTYPDKAWPLEFLVPVRSGQRLTARLTLRGADGEWTAPPLRWEVP